MSITQEKMVSNRKTHTKIDLHLHPGELVDIQIQVDGPKETAARSSKFAAWLKNVWAGIDRFLMRSPIIARFGSSVFLVFLLALAIFLFTRLYQLEKFPIYFYSDEATPVLRAFDLLNNDLKDAEQQLLPTFFWNDRKFSLGTTVYFQALTLLFFPRSVFLARLVTVLFGVLGMLWFALILQDCFRIRHGWVGFFLFVSTPAWFLFSRLAVETPVFTVFYTGSIYYYLRYRLGNPRNLIPCVLLGTIAFYTYFPGQIIIALTSMVLLISDWRYHWQNWKTYLFSLGLLLLSAIPLIRFIITHPDYYQSQMVQYGILSNTGMSFLTNLTNYLSRYIYGLSPIYWFNPVIHDPIWWVMKGYSHISWLLLPFFIWGLVVAIKGWRKPEMRVILAAFLAGPSGSALISIEITRVLVMIIPSLILITLGVSSAFTWLERRKWFHQSLLVISGLILSIVPFAMLYDVLINGPTWFTNYGLDGLQWGSREVYQIALEINKREPATKIIVSGDWNWQPDIMHRFFIGENENIVGGNADAFMSEYKNGLDSSLFILTPSEFEDVSNSDKFAEVKVESILNSPDGNPGFYILRLRYRDDVQDIFSAEWLARAKLIPGEIEIEGTTIPTKHTVLDAMPLQKAFDGDPESLIKSDRMNPLVIELDFPEPRVMNGLDLLVGSERINILVKVWLEDGTVKNFSIVAEKGDQNKTVSIPFDDVLMVSRLHIELHDVDATNDSFVHLWEVKLN
jgi:hypothetical protein